MKQTQIRAVQTEADLRRIRELFEAYESWLGIDLSFQDFEEELASLPGDYAPPEGCLLLAEAEGKTGGCVGLQPRSGTICEMKRLFVRERFRGQGLGRRLVERVLEEARTLGYERMRLETLPKMATARSLYASVGFEEIPPYPENPVPGAESLEKELVGQPVEANAPIPEEERRD